MKDYVYVLEKDQCFCKIGSTDNPEKRIRALELQGGFYAKRVALFGPFDTAASNEILAHQKFSKQRAIGEWFTVSYEDATSELRTLFGHTECEFRGRDGGETNSIAKHLEPREKLVAQKLVALFESLSDSKKEYLLGFADGVAAMKPAADDRAAQDK